MPWQRRVADVGLEVVERDGQLVPCYREIICSVPRQNGKTTLVLAWEVDRALMWGLRQRIIYSAQTGLDARQKLLEDQAPLLHGDPEGSGPFSAAIQKVDKTNGREAILFRGGSRISTVASSDSAGHGKTIGLGVVDEAFNDKDFVREQALKPAMRTRRDAQLFICSTMGTDESLYLNAKVAAGRQIAEADKDTSRTAYFEWSAPEGADIEDPKVWAACTPALGYTIDLETIAAELEEAKASDSVGEFMRASLNMQTHSDERVISQAAWSAVCSDEVTPDGRMVVAVDCTPERHRSSVLICDMEGRIELLDSDRGTGWVVERAEQVARKWHAAIAVNTSGPAGVFVQDFERRSVRIEKVDGQDFVKACGRFYDAVLHGELSVRSNTQLDLAVAAAKKKPVGDAWAWTRKSSGDISPLVAATVAYAVARKPAGTSKFFSDEIWDD